MKKPKAIRKAIRDKKYEQKLIADGSFLDVLKAVASRVNKKTAKKVKR